MNKNSPTKNKKNKPESTNRPMLVIVEEARQQAIKQQKEYH